jgi:hypothetical protein
MEQDLGGPISVSPGFLQQCIDSRAAEGVFSTRQSSPGWENALSTYDISHLQTQSQANSEGASQVNLCQALCFIHLLG